MVMKCLRIFEIWALALESIRLSVWIFAPIFWQIYSENLGPEPGCIAKASLCSHPVYTETLRCMYAVYAVYEVYALSCMY